MSRVRQSLLYAALTVGTLDALDAMIFFGLRGAKIGRIFQAIASGLIGASAFNGGTATILLGVLLHYTVALSIAATFFLLASRFGALTRRPFLWGPLFGIAAYWVMNLVVVPLSAAKRANPTLPVIINGLLIHIVGVGTPTALLARRAFAPDD
jgi:hypothetical protein